MTIAVPRLKVHHFDRAEFLERRWHYKPGGHVTVLGPTDAGKSYLMYQLIETTASPQLPVITLEPKPRDTTVRQWSKKLGHRVVREWPPRWSPFRNNNPPGWTLWPIQRKEPKQGEDQLRPWRTPDLDTINPEADDAILELQFRRAFAWIYGRGNGILNADEALGIIDLGLYKWLRTMHTRGRSMGAGMWLNNQGPTDIGRYAYRMAAHLFIAYDPDEEARKRFDQIGGVDPKIVRAVTAELPPQHFLYIRRQGRVMCTIGP